MRGVIFRQASFAVFFPNIAHVISFAIKSFISREQGTLGSGCP